MTFLKSLQNYQHQAILFILMALALAGVLFFGLRPKDYDFSNRVFLVEGRGGFSFTPYSMAYTRPFDVDMVRRLESTKGFTLFLDFQPKPDFNDGFGLILVMHDGNDDEQMIIGQWRSHIVIMNGDDYAHKRRLPRISFDTSKGSGIGKSRIDKLESDLQLVLTSGRDGTRLFVDGKVVKEKPNMVLTVPQGKGPRLILGNSPYGRASWSGDIYRLALYPGSLSKNEIEKLASNGAGDGYPKKSGKAEPLFLYDFSAIDENKLADLSGNKLDLTIPNHVMILKKKILALPWQDFEADKGFFLDVVVNFLGFVPLGFLLAAFMQSLSLPLKHTVFMAVLICACLSLCIEVAQAWIPSRSSSLLDLVMNTMGAGGGAVFSLAHFVRVRRNLIYRKA